MRKDKKIKLIYNPQAGASRRQRTSLEDILLALQELGFMPEVWMVEKGSDAGEAVRDALVVGFRTIVVCGGDGTVSKAAGELVNTGATLAIIPTGTRNNVARSLGIPEDVKSAAALLRDGYPELVDTGDLVCEGRRMKFLEMCATGLIAAISPAGDAVRHGDVASVGEFLSTLVSAEPAGIELVLDGAICLKERGHVALVANMPYVGLSFQVCPDGCMKDGLLNVLHFADLSKIDLLKFIAGGAYAGKPEDPRIQHFTARTVDIRTDPPMPVMVDGDVIGKGPVRIGIKPGSLRVLIPKRRQYASLSRNMP